DALPVRDRPGTRRTLRAPSPARPACARRPAALTCSIDRTALPSRRGGPGVLPGPPPETGRPGTRRRTPAALWADVRSPYRPPVAACPGADEPGPPGHGVGARTAAEHPAPPAFAGTCPAALRPIGAGRSPYPAFRCPLGRRRGLLRPPRRGRSAAADPRRRSGAPSR